MRWYKGSIVAGKIFNGDRVYYQGRVVCSECEDSELLKRCIRYCVGR